jgi:hypothetical protein
MKLFKSLLLASATGMVAVSGASAADLGAKKPSPVEYVRACYNPLWGTSGGFVVPGTQTCVRVFGQARFDIGYAEQFQRSSNPMGYRGGLTVGLDAITPSEYGNVRAFAQIGAVYRTGSQFTGTGTRQGTFIAGGFGNGLNVSGGTEIVFAGFIQFAGFTMGRTTSFFDPVGGAPEIIGTQFRSSPGNVNTLAYTAALGNGFTATIAIEDPTVRQQPIITDVAGLASAAGVFNTAGRVVGRTGNRMPNVVGALRLDQAWGSASLSGVVGEVGTTNVDAFTGGFAAPKSQLGFAVAAGLKINLPMIAAGDALFLNAAYSDGMGNYATSNFFGGSAEGQGIGGAGWGIGDAVFDTGTGRLRKTRIWSVGAAFQHFWTPTLSSAIFGSYARVEQSGGVGAAAFIAAQPVALQAAFASTVQARSGNFWSVGLNTIWQPVRGLNIALEGAYVQANPEGNVYDINKNRITTGGAFCNIVTQGCRTVGSDSQFLGRLRVTRDF